VTLGLAVGVVFGWAACLMSGCAYGILGEGFGFMVMPDIYGVEASRFATQVAGLIQSTLLLIIFWLVRNRWPFAGAAFLMYTLLYFGGQVFLEFMRGDEALYMSGWRLTQLLDLVIALAAAMGLLVLWWRARREGEGLDDEEDDEDAESETTNAAFLATKAEEPEEAGGTEADEAADVEETPEATDSEVAVEAEATEGSEGDDSSEESPATAPQD
jgi:hypothetical protein